MRDQFFLALVILCFVTVLNKDSPILQVASFSEAEIASLSDKTIAALNCFTILYNSCSLMISVLTWRLIRKNLVKGEKWAFWMVAGVIGFIEVMAFFASSYIGNGRWQVNLVQSILYVTGIGLSGYPLFLKEKKVYSTSKIARTAGLFYLLYVITSFIANLFGKFVFVEAPVTVNHIMIHALQFRIGFVINLFSVVLFLLAAWALYVLLKPVNQDLALLFLLFNAAGFAFWLFSSLCLFGSLVILNGSETNKVFQPDQLQALALFFVSLCKNGVFIAQVPYGVWLFPLGYLVLKSGFLPKILGILLIADGICQFIYVCQRLILPDFAIIAYPCLVISFIAEVSLALWLSIKAVKPLLLANPA